MMRSCYAFRNYEVLHAFSKKCAIRLLNNPSFDLQDYVHSRVNFQTGNSGIKTNKKQWSSGRQI